MRLALKFGANECELVINLGCGTGHAQSIWNNNVIDPTLKTPYFNGCNSHNLHLNQFLSSS